MNIQTKRGPAKTIEPGELEQVLSYIDRNSKCPVADCLNTLLSYYAGLRVCEIFGLQLEDMTTATGRIAGHIRVRAETSKNGRGRIVPMHPRIHEALNAFRGAYPTQRKFAVTCRFRLREMKTVNALTLRFHHLYRAAGLQGCSSHSGRRSFVTNLARASDGSRFTIRDVQMLAGHARLDTTQRYIEPSQRLCDLVGLLGRSSTTEQEVGA